MVIIMQTQTSDSTIDVNAVVDLLDTPTSDLISTDDNSGIAVELLDKSQTADLTDIVKTVAEKKATGKKATDKVAAEKPAKEVKVKERCKADVAKEIFAKMFGKEGVERKHIIKAFQDPDLFGDLTPLTEAGASTYYQKLAPKKS